MEYRSASLDLNTWQIPDGTYHAQHLQVLLIGTLCHQQLFDNVVYHVSGPTLECQTKQLQGWLYYKWHAWVLESGKFKPLTSKHYRSAPIHIEISGKQQSLHLKLGRDWDNTSGLPTINIYLPVLAISCWFWINKFWIGETGVELPDMMSCHWHICNPCRESGKHNLRWKNFTFWSYLWQQYATVPLS